MSYNGSSDLEDKSGNSSDLSAELSRSPPQALDASLLLREWSPLTNLLSKIPMKAQKGLTTLDLKLTCIAAVAEFLAVGTNVGLIYWYDRKLDNLDRLRTQDSNSPITTLSLLSSVDYMLAAGNKDGLITIFQIPKPIKTLPGFNNNNSPTESKTQRFTVNELHNGPITSLEWSKNGLKLFSGDAAGNVVLTDVEYDFGFVKSKNLLCEQFQIVQLSYARKNLLVCSIVRSIIYSLESNTIFKVGTQDRKSEGRFGGVFRRANLSDDLKVYSVRPGGRIWVADSTGIVEQTIKYKELFLENQYNCIPVINPTPNKTTSHDFQLGTLHCYMKTFLATYYKNTILVIDPVNTLIIGICKELKSVLDLTVCESEIFALDSDRSVVRLSYIPDKQTDSNSASSDFFKGMSKIPNIMSASMSDFRLPQDPMNFLASKLKETSRALPKMNSSLLNTLKNVIEIDMDIQDGQYTVIPPVIPLRDAVPNIVLDTPTTTSPAEEPSSESPIEDKFGHISKQPFDEVLLNPVSRRKKKKRRSKQPDPLFQSSIDTVSDAISLSSAYSTNSEGDPTLSSGIATRFSSSSSAQSSQSASTTSESSKQHFDFSNLKTSHQHLSRSSSFLAHLVPPEVSQPDLETKEEILARKLKWPELLPDSLKCSAIDDIFNEGTPIILQQLQRNTGLDLQAQENSEEAVTDDTCDGESSISTIKDVQVVSDSEYSSSDLSSQSSTLTLTTFSVDNIYKFSEDEHDDSEDENISPMSHVFDESVDIYTMYRMRDDSQNNSIASALSFGPPTTVNSLCDPNASQNQESLKEEVSLPSSTTLVSDVLSAEAVDIVVDQVLIGNDSWVSYKAPSALQSISCCDSYVVCTDTKNSVYYSRLDQLSLRWIGTDYQANQVAVSSCGSVVWRIFKGTLYSLRTPSQDAPIGIHNGEWSKISSNVASAAVKKHVGWLVKLDGTVMICCGLLESAMVPEFEKVDCASTIVQLSLLDNSVWVVASEGKVLYRGGITETSCKGTEWLEKKWDIGIPPVTTLCVGPAGTAWIADAHNNLYFTNGIGPDSASGNSFPWKVLICDQQCSFIGSVKQGGRSSSLSNWKKTISNTLIPDRLTSLLTSKTVSMISCSNFAIWYSTSGSSSIFLNKTSIEGHGWKSIKIDRPLHQTAWMNLYAGSIYKEHGYLWLLDSKDKLLYSTRDGKRLQALDLPCSKELVCTTPAPDALWVLTIDGDVYGRCNISSNNPAGHGWDLIDLSPLDGVHLNHISCGSDVAWACDKKGKVYMRTGSLRPTSLNDISPAWVQVDGSPIGGKGCIFTKVYVGTSGSMVWALDSNGNVYVREAIYPDFPIGTRWLPLSGIEAVELALSDIAVWALSSKGDIFRRYGISKTDFVGNYWKKVPGDAKILTASLCDEIWILDGSGQILKHSQKVISLKAKPKIEKPPLVLDPEDKDWEFVESL